VPSIRLEIDVDEKRGVASLKAFGKMAEQELGRGSHKAKEFGSNFVSLTGSVLKAAPAFAVATAAISGVYSALRLVRDEFVGGLKAVEDYNLSVASMSAFMATFSERAAKGDMAGAFQEATAYAHDLVEALEIIDAKTIATGQDLRIITETMMQNGVVLDVTSQKQVEGFTSMVNALKLLTAGQNQEVQQRQEINALLHGQVRATDRLATMLKAIVDPQLEEHLKQWKAKGAIIENVGALLKGFNSATEMLQGTWAVLGSTLSTINERVLRSGMQPAYEDLLGLAADIRDTFIDADGNLTQFSKNLQETIQNAWESTASFFSSLTDALRLLKDIYQVFGEIKDQYPVISGSNIFGFQLPFSIGGMGEKAANYLGFDKDFPKKMSAHLQELRRALSENSFKDLSFDDARKRLAEMDSEVKALEAYLSNPENKNFPQYWSAAQIQLDQLREKQKLLKGEVTGFEDLSAVAQGLAAFYGYDEVAPPALVPPPAAGPSKEELQRLKEAMQHLEKMQKAKEGLALDVRKLGLNEFDAKVVDIIDKARQLREEFGDKQWIAEWSDAMTAAVGKEEITQRIEDARKANEEFKRSFQEITYAALPEQARELQQVRDQYASLNEQLLVMAANGDIFWSEQQRLAKGLSQQLDTSITEIESKNVWTLERLGQKTEETFEQRMQTAVSGWASSFSSEMTNAMFSAEFSFSKIAESFAKMIMQMVIQVRIIEPLLRNFGFMGAGGGGGNWTEADYGMGDFSQPSPSSMTPGGMGRMRAFSPPPPTAAMTAGGNQGAPIINIENKGEPMSVKSADFRFDQQFKRYVGNIVVETMGGVADGQNRGLAQRYGITKS